MGSHRDDQLVIREDRVVAQANALIVENDLGHVAAELQLDIVLRIPVGVVNRQVGLCDFASEISREIQAVVRRVRLPGHKRNFGLGRSFDESLDGRYPRDAGADNDQSTGEVALTGRLTLIGNRLEAIAWRGADRTDLRRLGSCMNVTAVEASPLVGNRRRGYGPGRMRTKVRRRCAAYRAAIRGRRAMMNVTADRTQPHTRIFNSHLLMPRTDKD